MTSFASIIDLFGNALMEEQTVEEDRKYEGCCILTPNELGELWSNSARKTARDGIPKTARDGLQIRARGIDDVKDPMKDLVRSPRNCRCRPRAGQWGRHSTHTPAPLCARRCRSVGSLAYWPRCSLGCPR